MFTIHPARDSTLAPFFECEFSVSMINNRSYLTSKRGFIIIFARSFDNIEIKYFVFYNYHNFNISTIELIDKQTSDNSEQESTSPKLN